MGDGRAGGGKRSDWAPFGGCTCFHELLQFELERGRDWAGIERGGVAHEGIGLKLRRDKVELGLRGR